MKIDLVDVFGTEAFAGNPLAVVHDAQGLSDAQMLALTRWIGFSETTFLLPPTREDADYRVRIFYPAGELPFAGHPTLGSCHAWLQAGGVPRREGRVMQECGVGLVEVRQEGEIPSFRAPPLSRHEPLDPADLAEAIRLTGIDPATVVEGVHIVNGPKWKLLRLDSAAAVLAADPSARAEPGTDIGIAGPIEPGGAADWELRAFFADELGRFREDPVTGSFNAGVALHLFGDNIAAGSYRAAQGRKTGANGIVNCVADADGGAWIGGRCDTISSGGALPVFE